MKGLAQFAAAKDESNPEEAENTKLAFIFRIYDMDGDGFISNGELFQVRRGPIPVPV